MSGLVARPGRTKADQRASERRYQRTPKGLKRRYVKRGKEYLARPFIAIDGEGTEARDGSGRQCYSILSATGVDPILDPDGLPFDRIIDFLFELKREHGAANYVVFGASYDWNFWVHHLGRDDALRLYQSDEFVEIDDLKIKWIPGKIFHIVRGRESIVVYDVLPFFQSSFIVACDKYLKDVPYWQDHRDQIVREKGRRGAHTWDDARELAAYNDAELVLLVMLMDELRAALDKIGVRPSRWDGPGAIATKLLLKEKVDEALSRNNPILTPDAVLEATRYAFTAGRFETFKHGVHSGPAHQHDLNGAYPGALRRVPCLAHGQWVHYESDTAPLDGFGLHRVHFRASPSARKRMSFFPLFVRTSQDRLWYPGEAHGWYWSPEASAAREYSVQTGSDFTVEESWVWEHDDGPCLNPYPFRFIDGLYDLRRQYKEAGDGAEKAVKLGLNSKYGKLAQQVGWKVAGPKVKGNHVTRSGKSVRIPPFHQLEWAGYTTASCRAHIVLAGLSDPDALIAAETDALFTLRPLDVSVGAELEQWDRTDYTDITYMQSGMYAATKVGGEIVAKERGVNRGELWTDDRGEHTRERVLQALKDNTPIRATLTRFIGLGAALIGDNFGDWCTWQTVVKEVSPYPATGKRVASELHATTELLDGLLPSDLNYDLQARKEFTSYPCHVEWEDDGLPGTDELRLEMDLENGIM